MTLLEKQVLFKKLFRVLELYAEALGFVLVDGMHWRSVQESHRLVEEGSGVHPSAHERCLAAHLELFWEGRYLTDTDEYEHLGLFWERLHPLCRWGGHFPRPDGCHFSMEHNGIA